MRLYNKKGATQVDDPEYGTFTPGGTGAFDGLPDPMYAKLFGRPDWESEAQRAARLTAEQMEKLRDPATMLAELQKMTASQGELTAILANAFAAAQAPAATAVPATPAAVVAPPEAVAKADAETVAAETPKDVADVGPGDAEGPAEPIEPAPKTARASKKAAAAPAAS